MTDHSLKSKILMRFRQKWKEGYGGYVASGAIERWASEHTKKPSNAGRRLRELAEDGLLERTEFPLKESNVKQVHYRYLPTNNEIISLQMKNRF